jgi:hypothetical protein
VCGGVAPANTSAIRQVVETRRRKYPFREKVNPFRKDGRTKRTDDPGGVGFEIVREILICPACAELPARQSIDVSNPPALAA